MCVKLTEDYENRLQTVRLVCISGISSSFPIKYTDAGATVGNYSTKIDDFSLFME